MADNAEPSDHSRKAEGPDDYVEPGASTQIASGETLRTLDVVGKRKQTLLERIQQWDTEKNVAESQPQKTLPSTEEKRITELQSDVSSKDMEIRELKEEVMECKEMIQTLEKQVATLQEINDKQKVTIKNQSETIQKNPAPHKNRERYLASLFQQGFIGTGGAPVSSENLRVAPRQQPVNAGSERERVRFASILPGPIVQPPRTRASAAASAVPHPIQGNSSIHAPPSRPFRAFSCGNLALQEDNPLEILQGGGFATHQILPASANSEFIAGQLQSQTSLPGSTIGGRSEVVPPPGLETCPHYTKQIPHGIGDSGSQLRGLMMSNEASIRQIGNTLGELFGKVNRWTRDYAGGDRLISISPKIIEMIRSIDLSDQLGLNLLSQHKTKGFVIARAVNAFIKDHILTPDFPMSIDPNFNSQVLRTYARVPSEGPGPAHLHQDVMVNIASLFRTLPQRADWTNWLATQVPALTSELYYLVDILLDYHVRGPMELGMLGRLTEIVSDAIDASLLMYIRPFMYRLPFPETGTAFNPAEMEETEGGTSSEDSSTAMVVVLAVAPMVVAECWENGQLSPYIIRRSEVFM